MGKAMITDHWDFRSLSNHRRDQVICVIAQLTAMADGAQVLHCSWCATSAAWVVDDYLNVVLSWNEDGYKVDYAWMGDQMPTEKAIELAKTIDSIFGDVTLH